MPTGQQVVDIARQFLFVREAQSIGQNRGLRVEAIQHWSNGQFGDSWCMQFATMVLDIAFQGKAPLDRQGSCQAVYDIAKKNGWVTTTPNIGDLFLYVNDQDHAHHVGIVTSVSPLIGIAGNTSEDGTSNNGDRVAEHSIKSHVFVAYPR
jgi:hypothetical protein